jgi:hypothetical protein
MASIEFLAGAALFALSAFAWWIALPKDGQVRAFMRNDQVQAYYSVAFIGGLVFGLLSAVLGAVAMLN